MITTVTTSTISTITMVSTAIGLIASLGLVAVIALIGFLGMKELATAGKGVRQRLFARSLNVGIVPLIIVFTVIAAMRVLEVLI